MRNLVNQAHVYRGLGLGACVSPNAGGKALWCGIMMRASGCCIMPCPKGLHIPEIFKLMNYHRVYKLAGYAQEQYALIGHTEERQYKDAAACIDCGLCEKKCPQKLKIREQLRQTHAELAPV
ncbi:MAG: 4Fe-4S dicluster domain-containing protein [Treponema sp.]|nr:4Fe-4S dicluster domain-containing protein [Treponema sp.]